MISSNVGLAPKWCINTPWPNGATWRQRSGLTLAQVMACCLAAPSHYLNQCCLIINRVQWGSSEDDRRRYPSPTNQLIGLNITYLKFYSNLADANELIIQENNPNHMRIWGDYQVSLDSMIYLSKTTKDKIYKENIYKTIKTVFPRYGDSHVKDKTVARPSYL